MYRCRKSVLVLAIFALLICLQILAWNSKANEIAFKDPQKDIKLGAKMERSNPASKHGFKSNVVAQGCRAESLTNSTICLHGETIRLDASNATAKIEIYNRIVSYTAEPTKDKKVFVQDAPGINLQIVLIECVPKPNSRLIPIIYNLAHIYGGSNVAFTIIHDEFFTQQLAFLDASPWHGIQRVVKKLESIHAYNQMLTSEPFWNSFKSKFVLITHTDAINFRAVDPEFFQFDLVGAPWPHQPTPAFKGRPRVGNGGHTLRRVEAMQNVLATTPVRTEPEDVWWSLQLDVSRIPLTKDAARFCSELLRFKDEKPSASHQLFKYHFETSGVYLQEYIDLYGEKFIPVV